MSTNEERWDGVDWVKAAAICAVIAQHSGIEFMPMTPFELVVRTHASAFHVPAFFMVSGFLYAGHGPISLSTLGRRLLRLLVPFLLASLVAHACGFVIAPAKDSVDVLLALLGLPPGGYGPVTHVLLRIVTASSMGIYYFVMLMVFFQLLSFPLSRLSSRAIQMLLVVAVTYLVLWAQDDRFRTSYNFFWEIRNPLHSWHFFLIGWLVKLHWNPLRDLFRRNRAQVIAVCLAGVLVYAVAMLSPQLPASRLYRTVYSLAVVGLLLALVDGRRPPGAVMFVSASTYAIFLYHHMIQLVVDRYTVEWHDVARFAFLFAIGLAGGALVAVLGRRLGPRWGRLLVGT